jgi:hypothetical protein
MARHKERTRRGAMTLEFALVIPLYITIISTTVLGGIRIFQNHRLTAMAKYLARKAIVHGDSAEQLGTWGPLPVFGSIGDGSPIGNMMANKYTDGNPTNIYYRLSWPDNGNDGSRGDRVWVRIATYDLSGNLDFQTEDLQDNQQNMFSTSASVILTIMH